MDRVRLVDFEGEIAQTIQTIDFAERGKSFGAAHALPRSNANRAISPFVERTQYIVWRRSAVLLSVALLAAVIAAPWLSHPHGALRRCARTVTEGERAPGQPSAVPDLFNTAPERRLSQRRVPTAILRRSHRPARPPRGARQPTRELCIRHSCPPGRP